MSRHKLLFLVVMVVTSSLLAACGDDDPVAPPAANSFALAFDGVDERVYVPDHDILDLPGGIFTLSCWYFFPSNVAGVPGLVQKDGDASFGRYGIWVSGDQIDFCVTIDGGSQSCLMSTGGLNPSSWNHIAATYDGTEMKVYLNGVLDASRTLTGAISASDRPLYIGGDPTEPAFLPGQISDVRLWEVALTEPEIQAGMFDRLTGGEARLVAYWRMDEGTGQMAVDAGPNGFDAILGVSSNPDPEDPTWVELDWPVGP